MENSSALFLKGYWLECNKNAVLAVFKMQSFENFMTRKKKVKREIPLSPGLLLAWTWAWLFPSPGI